MNDRNVQGGDTLVVKKVSKRFGGVQAVDDAAFSMSQGSVSGLIGPNGAGKSTLVGILSGFIRHDTGSVLLGEKDISGLNPVQRCEAGLTRTFQQATPFKGLTVIENVLVGMTKARRSNNHSRGTPRARANDILKRFELDDCADMDAGSLPFGRLRFMEMARALATDPHFLLLDEPAAGLNNHETIFLEKLIRQIVRENVGVLLIDHDVPFVFRLCDSIAVMDAGKTIAYGTPQEIERDPAVRAAYLAV